VLVVPLPIVIMVIWLAVWKYAVRLAPTDSRNLDILLSVLGFVEAMAMTFSLTEFIKSYVGRKRPNFFAMCNYQGYRNALETNNFTNYNLNTTPGLPGDLSNCWETDISIIRDSQYSFPSGHSASAFCALVFCGLVLTNSLHDWSKKHNMIKGLVMCCFVWSAVMVAGTRPRDYWHNFDDILGGAAIGATMAILSFYLNYATVGPALDKFSEGMSQPFVKV